MGNKAYNRCLGPGFVSSLWLLFERKFHWVNERHGSSTTCIYLDYHYIQCLQQWDHDKFEIFELTKPNRFIVAADDCDFICAADDCDWCWKKYINWRFFLSTVSQITFWKWIVFQIPSNMEFKKDWSVLDVAIGRLRDIVNRVLPNCWKYYGRFAQIWKWHSKSLNLNSTLKPDVTVRVRCRMGWSILVKCCKNYSGESGSAMSRPLHIRPKPYMPILMIKGTETNQ